MSADRNNRLASDYREMLSIQDQPYLSWIVTKGEPPYAEEYLLNINVRTYAFRMHSGECRVGAIHGCTVKMELWPSYPKTAPYIRMLDIPPAFHPNWYSKGTYCPPTSWSEESSLKDFVKQMIATLQYNPQLIETDSPANFKALDWYLKNKEDPSLFPSDTTKLSENSAEKAAEIEKAAATLEEVVDSWSVR